MLQKRYWLYLIFMMLFGCVAYFIIADQYPQKHTCMPPKDLGRRVGAYVPQCTAEGNYLPKQIWGSTGYSWCVSADGFKIDDTSSPPGNQSELNCEAVLENLSVKQKWNLMIARGASRLWSRSC